MRYYIYLDKVFLRTLFGALDKFDFKIDVMEYSIRKSYTKNNEVRLEPCIESIKDGENGKREEGESKVSTSCRNSCMNKERVGISYDAGNAYNIQTERKYLNIEDITDVKNTNFYHKMLSMIEELEDSRNDRLTFEVGYIKICNSDRFTRNFKDFFMINDTFVWFNNQIIQGDIELLSEMSCEVSVIGYKVSCDKLRKNKIIKAIAIYIQ